MNKNLKRLAEPGARLYLVFLGFCRGGAFFKMYELAAAEGAVILLLLIYGFFCPEEERKTARGVYRIHHL